MSKVYVIQDSPGKNLEPAKEYGEMIVMLTGNESISDARQKLRKYLGDFTTRDHLLLIGNPKHIAMASIIASFAEDTISFLIWDREHYRYDVETISC